MAPEDPENSKCHDVYLLRQNTCDVYYSREEPRPQKVSTQEKCGNYLEVCFVAAKVLGVKNLDYIL